jgi:asparagine synthase (glutamine-hydrolysing)
MCSDDGRLVLVFNGEIYNYRELRVELEALGHRFRSSGDTEVLLRAYQQWGTACVERFNGMWAFLVHDRARGVVFGSRDRFGVKPLYVAEVPEGSPTRPRSRRCARSARRGARLVARERVARHRRARPGAGARAHLLRGIREVPPATAFEVHLDGRPSREWTYWSLDGVRRATAPADAGEEYAALFEDAIRLQARADVPLAVSSRAGSTRRRSSARSPGRRGTRLEAFTYNSEEHDESRYVRATIAWTAPRLHPVVVTPEQLFEGAARAARRARRAGAHASRRRSAGTSWPRRARAASR